MSRPSELTLPGAGPSGLVAAKNLLGAGFRVTIFEGKDRVGGLWPVRKDEVGGLVHPLMVANQSKHTVQFSDLAWEEDAPQLPRAWQIGRYLERYRDRYCKDADIRLGSNVAAAEPVSVVDHMGQASTNWRLIVETPEGGRERLQFDYLLIAAGFFSRPALPGVHFEQAGIPVIHSSAYRNLSSLGLPAADKGKNILVVGGQMSGVEIAGTIATHLSSATNATGPSCIPELVSYSVQHVIQRPVWVFPLHTSPNVSEVFRHAVVKQLLTDHIIAYITGTLFLAVGPTFLQPQQPSFTADQHSRPHQ